MTIERCVPWCITLAAAGALMAVAGAGCSRGSSGESTAWEEPPPLEVDVATVSQSPIHESLKLNGSLIPLRFANIVSEVDGVIQKIPACGQPLQYKIGDEVFTRDVTLDIGHRVKKDQTLVEIDPTESNLALAAAQAKLRLAQNELAKLKVWRREEEKRQLKAQYDEAVAVAERCQNESRRAERLFEKNTISKEEYDRVTTACTVAAAVKEKAEAAWEVARVGPTKEEVAIAEANVDLAAAEVAIRQDKVRKCTIKAPYDGVITERYVGEGDRVTAMPRVEILQIIDPSFLFAQVAVPERYQGRIRVGDPAEIRARGVTDVGVKEPVGAGQDAPNAQGGFVPAIVGLINDRIDPQTRTFRARVGIDNRAGPFKAGTFAQVELSVKSASHAVVVPAAAVAFADGQPVVFLLNGDHVRRRAVRLGITSRDQQHGDQDRYEVLAGLAPGDRIVVGNATAMLADGMTVRPRNAGAVAGGSTPTPPKSDASEVAAAPEARP